MARPPIPSSGFAGAKTPTLTLAGPRTHLVEMVSGVSPSVACASRLDAEGDAITDGVTDIVRDCANTAVNVMVAAPELRCAWQVGIATITGTRIARPRTRREAAQPLA